MTLLIATDLDGTLFGSDRRVSPRNRAVLARAQALGHRVVFATGRMFRATLPYAQECGITTPLVTYQGAWIRDPVTLATWHHQVLSRDLALEALAALAPSGLHVNMYVDDEFWIERPHPAVAEYQRISGVAPREVGPFGAALRTGPTKLVAIGAPEIIQAWVPRLQHQFGARLYVTESLPTFLEIAHPTVSKSAALARLAAHWEIPRERVVAFGDGMNDLDMLRYAGLGVAMGQASATVRAAADRVAPPVQANGLAEVLEEVLDAS